MMSLVGSEVWWLYGVSLAAFASCQVSAGASKRKFTFKIKKQPSPRADTRLQHLLYLCHCAVLDCRALTTHAYHRHHVSSTGLGRSTQHSTSRPQCFLPSSQ